MTREEAIDILKNTIVRFGRTNGKTAYVEALQMAIQALQEPQWIPCSQKLPGEDKHVLICLEDEPEEEYYCRMAVGWLEDGYWNCWDDRADPRMNVIAWMPLPEPFKGGE